MRTRLLVTLLAGVALSLGAARAAMAAPASALVMPFDASAGSVSFLVASHPARDGAPGGVRTHWAFWDESCTHLLDAVVCLPADGSVVVDPTTVPGAASAGDLTGHRGFVTVTAYQDAGACDAAQPGPAALARDALIGSFTLAAVASGVSFGGTAIALPADATGAFVDLPGDEDGGEDGGDARQTALRLQTFAPSSLDVSRVILLALRERTGSGAHRATEPGPAVGGNDTVRAGLRYADKDGASIALPDASLGCATFSSLRDGDVPTMLPPGGPGDEIASGGLVALENPRIGDRPLGGTTRLYGFHAQAVGTFGVLAVGDAAFASSAQPTPSAAAGTPTPRPSVTATARPSPTPGPSATAPATPGGSPTPRPTASLVAPTSSPGATPTTSASATPGPSPTSGAVPTGGATPVTTATPGATSSPRPTATTPATPGATPAATSTASPSVSPSPPQATPTPAGCSTVTVEVRTTYGPSGPADVSGVIATVAYPATVAIPGTGGASSVLGRVSNVSGASGLFSATDTDSALRAGLISVSAAIPQGPLVRIVFDCVGGAVPQPGAFACTLEASTLGGALVPGATCTTEIIP